MRWNRHWFGPLPGWEMVRLARGGQQVRWRTITCGLFLVSLFFVYSNSFPGLDPFALGSLDTGIRVAPRDSAAFSARVLYVFMMLQLTMVVLLTPVYVIGGITEEYQRKTMDYLLATELSGWEIGFGKLIARLAHVGAVVLAGLPILALMQFFGGIDFGTMMAAYLVVFMTLFSLGGVSLLVGVTHKTMWPALWRVYGIFFGLSIGMLCCGICIGPIAAASPYLFLAQLFSPELDSFRFPLFIKLPTYVVFHFTVGWLCLRRAVRRIRTKTASRRRLPPWWVGDQYFEDAERTRDLVPVRPGRNDARSRAYAHQPVAPGYMAVPPGRLPPADQRTAAMGELPMKRTRSQADIDTYTFAAQEVVAQPRIVPVSRAPAPGPQDVPPVRGEGRDPDTGNGRDPFAPPKRRSSDPVILTRERTSVPQDDEDVLLWKEMWFRRRSWSEGDSLGFPIVTLILIILVGMIALLALTSVMGNGFGRDAQEYRGIIVWLGGMLMLVPVIGTGLNAAQSIIREREQQTMQSLLMLPLERRSILVAKWKAAIARTAGWLWFPGALMVVGLYTGAVSFLALPGVLAFAAGSLMAVSTLGIALSLSARTSMRAQVYFILCLIAAVVLPMFLGEGVEFAVRQLLPKLDPVACGEVVSSANVGTTWQTLIFPIERAGVAEFAHSNARARIYGSLLCLGAMWLGTLAVSLLAIRRFEREGRDVERSGVSFWWLLRFWQWV